VQLEKPLVLLGFMAVGKSTVGHRLAERLSVQFYDTDEEVVKSQSMSVGEIFDKYGEAHFRTLEENVFSMLLAEKEAVISTGGGLPCQEKSIALISSHCHSVHITVGADRLMERLLADDSRPLVNGKSKSQLLAFIKSKLRERNSYYNKADITVRGIGSPDDIADRIIRKLKKLT